MKLNLLRAFNSKKDNVVGAPVSELVNHWMRLPIGAVLGTPLCETALVAAMEANPNRTRDEGAFYASFLLAVEKTAALRWLNEHGVPRACLGFPQTDS